MKRVQIEYNYFYYSENHPRYNKNADFLRPSNKNEKTVKHPYSFDKGSKQSPLGVEIQIGEHRGNAGGIDRTEIRLNNVQNDIVFYLEYHLCQGHHENFFLKKRWQYEV